MIDLHKITAAPDIHRLLPQSSESEQALLSSFLQAPDYTADICAAKGITPAHFHNPAHAMIFTLLLEMHDANHRCDFVTLTQALRNRGQLEACGGAAFVTGLFTFIPTALNAAYDADFLINDYTSREIISVCTQYAGRGYDPLEQPAALLDELEAQVMAIRKAEDIELREVSPREGVLDAVAALERLYECGGAISGLSTGFADLGAFHRLRRSR